MTLIKTESQKWLQVINYHTILKSQNSWFSKTTRLCDTWIHLDTRKSFKKAKKDGLPYRTAWLKLEIKEILITFVCVVIIVLNLGRKAMSCYFIDKNWKTISSTYFFGSRMATKLIVQAFLVCCEICKKTPTKTKTNYR